MICFWDWGGRHIPNGATRHFRASWQSGGRSSGIDTQPDIQVRGRFEQVTSSHSGAGASGRVSIQNATTVRTAAWVARIQRARPENQVSASMPAITATERSFVLRSMLPCRCQLSTNGPKCRCSISQLCNRGELRAKANAATSRNGVVGTSGNTVPTMPHTVARRPSSSQTERFIVASPRGRATLPELRYLSR